MSAAAAPMSNDLDRLRASAKYRRDIDGLRTIAILPVLLFHAGVQGMGGGYVGVDVFFVISGFLITGIISRQIEQGRFSILNFYERRLRRIAPALALVILTTIVLSVWIFYPKHLATIPAATLSALFFISNIYYYYGSGYFASDAHIRPLLHTWSLAVEEQFYIFFPILLIIIARWFKRYQTLLLCAMLALSLALSIMMVKARPDFAFYLLPTRAWELLAGALLAVGAVPALRSAIVREIASLAGLAAILLAVFLYGANTPFPGLAALPPVLGTALLIHCAPQTVVGRLLASTPMVGIGLISYSLYLWHWPIIVFTEYAIDGHISGLWTIAVIIASFAIAYISWRFIEHPFRDHNAISARTIFKASGATALILASIAGVLAINPGWPERFDQESLRLIAFETDYSPVRDKCRRNDPKKAPCILGGSDKASVAVWGTAMPSNWPMSLAKMRRRLVLVWPS